VVNPSRDPVVFDLDTGWQHLRWPLDGDPTAVSPYGTARFSGTANQYGFEVDAELIMQDVPPSHWNLKGRGTAEGVDIDPLYGEILEGWIHGTGSIDWAPEIRWDFTVVGDGMDPGFYLADLPGSIGFEARTTGEMVDDEPTGEFHLIHLDGELKGLPLRGSGSAELNGESASFANLDLGIADATLAASGEILGPWHLEWRLDVPSIASLHPGYTGSLSGRGSLVGQDSIPGIRFAVNADSVAFGAGRITSVRADADLHPVPGGNLALDVAVNEIRFFQGAKFDSILIRSRGTTAQHEMDVLFHVDADSMQLAFAGAISDSTWTGALQQLRLRAEGVRDWDLKNPAPLFLSPRHAELRDFCWVAGNSRVCLEALWDRDSGWNLDSSLDHLELAVLDRLFPEEASFETKLDGHARARGRPSGVDFADVKIESEAGAIHWVSQGRDLYLNLEPGLLTFAADSQSANGVFRLGLGGGTVEANLLLPDYRAVQGDEGTPIKGRLKLEMPDLSTIQGLSPELGSIQGVCSADLELSGTTASPRVTGEAQLEDGRVEFPRLGLEVTEISLSARSSQEGQWEINGGMTSGPGRIQIEANTDLSDMDEGKTSLRLTGDRFEVVNTLDSRVLVSPELRVTQKGKRLDVEGEVNVPEANIVAGRADLAMAVPVSQDIVFAASARAPPPPPLDLHARVRLVLGKSVRFRGFGIRSRLTGNILVTEGPGKPTQGDGELNLTEGTFTGYGRELQIDRGKLIFPQGPIDNPEVDVRASRRADDGTVAGVEVRGRLQSMEMTVFSEPERNPEDAISYLLYGRPLNDASTQEANMAQQTAALLTMQAGSQLTQRMASSLGLEEARIESEGSMKEASLMLGTHLSPRVYVAYGIGLFDAVNSFRVRYLLNNRWTVQAETGQQSSADLIFSIEK
jgi:translocation and assembly module TamB